MTCGTVANEFAKMRRLRVWLVVALLLAGLTGLTAFQSVLSSAFADSRGLGEDAWMTLFGNLGMAVPLVSPVLLAVLASRQVEIEHLGNGWLLSATSGVAPGHLCRAKFLALGVLVALATVLVSVLLIGFGLLLGATRDLPIGHWLGYTASVTVANLAVLAFQLLLSARVENQLVCVGVGMVGVFVGVFAPVLPTWLAHLTPWGYYSLTTPADYVGTELVYLDIPYSSVLALAVVGGALFLLLTGRLNSQEA